MSHQSVAEILGDYCSFFADQRQRLLDVGVDITGLALSHLAYRVATMEEYIEVRTALEAHCSSNVENVWNGRPISKIILTKPLEVGFGHTVDMIELIPPVHQDDYPMGFEHTGVVIGDEFETWYTANADKISGHQDQGPYCQPRYIRFDNKSMVKFYLRGLQQVCELEGRVFDGIYHDDTYNAAPLAAE